MDIALIHVYFYNELTGQNRRREFRRRLWELPRQKLRRRFRKLPRLFFEAVVSIRYGRKSSRMGLNISSSTPASRQVHPWMTPSVFSSVSPGPTSRVSPSMVKEKRPLTT